MDIWSVGHGARPLEEFVAILREADIKALADVRLLPGSRRHPHFSAESLESALRQIGIAYQHLPALGGRREPLAESPHRALRVAAFRGYADHMDTEEFARGYERLTTIASESRTAIMCAETLWWRCHRRLIADRLTVDGWTVTHLFAPGKSERHVVWDAARTLDGHLVYDAGDVTVADMTRTWDADWDERKAGKGCPMCSEGRPDDTYGNARVFAGRVSDAYLVRGDIGQPGYTIVIWRGGHIADLTDLTDSDATTYLREVLKVARALEAHFQPAKMNLEMLGNTVPHLHTHLVPRYVTDDSPGQPAKGLMQPDPHRKPIADDVFHRDVAALRVALSRMTERRA